MKDIFIENMETRKKNVLILIFKYDDSLEAMKLTQTYKNHNLIYHI